MYWATSFCEREQSSKRARMYLERLWCSLATAPCRGGAMRSFLRGVAARELDATRPPLGRGAVVGVATRFIGVVIRRPRLALLPDRVRQCAALSSMTSTRSSARAFRPFFRG